MRRFTPNLHRIKTTNRAVDSDNVISNNEIFIAADDVIMTSCLQTFENSVRFQTIKHFILHHNLSTYDGLSQLFNIWNKKVTATGDRYNWCLKYPTFSLIQARSFF